MAYPTIGNGGANPWSQPEIEVESPGSHPNLYRHTIDDSATSAAHPVDYCYDVFISHRGPDTKKTFASALYLRLSSLGLRVFLDLEELQEGENIMNQIEGAIRSASVYLAIFSPRYAESSWCLDELVLMLESTGFIIPIFYRVKPSDLRWTRGKTGVYAQALEALESKKTSDSKMRFHPSTIERWRNALSSVASISGLELNDDEGVLLEKVVEVVLSKVKKTRLNVAKYPTGLDEKVKDLESVLQQQQKCGKPQVVGIVGLGGVGKTTLSKELFNRKSSRYSRSCFIFDVRQNSDKPSLLCLQKKLLKNLTGSDLIESIEQGIEAFKNPNLSYHALIILDDVDSMDQMDALLPVQNALSLNSMIVITSRNKDILTNSRVKDSAIYNLHSLGKDQSRELFCYHAFEQPDPLPGFENLVSRFLKKCHGLPLSLKVLGAMLCGKTSLTHWEYQLEKLKDILPHEIKETLKISYEALDIEEQEMFLDIACFFVEEEKDMAMKIWDATARWKGPLGFETLENRCLVEVDSKLRIKMHDHLRDMGREIAEASGLPRRLCRGTQNIDDLLQQSYVITEVRGIRMLSDDNTDGDGVEMLSDDNDDSSEMSCCERWSHELFWSPAMKIYELFWNSAINICNRLHNTRNYRSICASKLQFLDVEDSVLERILMRVCLPNLIWLRWRKCRDYSLPSWIPMGNLRVLQVSGSVLEELWQGGKSQGPLQLRELVIVSPLLKLPKYIGRLKHLEVVVLRESKLQTLPSEFCRLRSLKRFELTNCSKIKSLPYSFGSLTNLEHIDLSSCCSLMRLPDTFGNLIRLKHLILNGCSDLAISSETLGNVKSLEHIDLSHCSKIEVLPPQVERQPLLEKLLLEGTNLKVPSAFEDLSDSEEIVLESHLLGSHLMGDLSNLKKVMFQNCKDLRCLPDSIGLLTQMTKLTVYDCALRKLCFKTVQEETESDPDSEGSLSQGVCPDLQHLRIVRCNDLEEVGKLPNTLRRLEFTNCSKLTKLEGLYGLSNLQMLYINGSELVEQLPSIGTLASLEELLALGCEKLKSIGGLVQLTRLRVLNLSYCHDLEELPSVEDLKSLEVLQAFECLKLKSLRGLMQLTKLRVVDVCGCFELEELPGIEHCRSLEKLDASKCPKLQWSEGVEVQLRQRVKELCL